MPYHEYKVGDQVEFDHDKIKGFVPQVQELYSSWKLPPDVRLEVLEVEKKIRRKPGHPQILRMNFNNKDRWLGGSWFKTI